MSNETRDWINFSLKLQNRLKEQAEYSIAKAELDLKISKTILEQANEVIPQLLERLEQVDNE